MDLRIMYQLPILKMMNALVFVDTFALIFLGIAVKGEMGFLFGAGYGLAGGIASLLMFNMIVLAFILLKSRPKKVV